MRFAFLIQVFVLNCFNLVVQSQNSGWQVATQCVQNGTVAITFDDGPHLYQTPGLLDILQENNVTAAFFIVGRNILSDESHQILKRTLNEGHTIASHTCSHQNLSAISLQEVSKEILCLEKQYFNITGQNLTIMRPPYGESTEEVQNLVINELGYKMVNWSIDTNDWRHPGDTAAGIAEYETVLNNTNPNNTSGFIALHHDIQNGAVDLALAAINYVRSLGYKFVSLSECLGLEIKK